VEAASILYFNCKTGHQKGKQMVLNMVLSLKKGSVKQVYCTQRSAMFGRMCVEGTEYN